MANPHARFGVLGMVVLVAAVVHCKKVTPCRATLTLGEHVATGEGPDKQQALAQACANHCIEQDPLVDGKYRVWRAAGGKGAGKRAEAIQSVPSLKRYFDACNQRCTTQAKDVRYIECREP
ncbi:MAG TPA: hypothetical protein VFU02_07565 [Polyangiaceae bacterium]|nr:hypothetical protein [Polyangiaceae bacterium]